MSGSKTVYYVSSSCSTIFDPDKRVKHLEAALLDYSANSVVELSEYMKDYYNSSRLRGYRGYLNWARNRGFNSHFGNTTSYFFSDASFNNTAISNAIKYLFSLGEDDTFGVYSTNLNFFSEDFYIKYLATQQGKASLVYQNSDINYTISYPTDTTIKATFLDGTVIQGIIPNNARNARFLEISYTIIRAITVTEEIPGENPDEPIIITKVEYKTVYGYYHYQENTGNTTLDSYIKNNDISDNQTFFPVVPLRANTAWFSGSNAETINSALKYLDIYSGKSSKESSYTKLIESLESGMQEGNIGDIDYITLMCGVAINSTHPADQRYLYEYFFNIHTNSLLKEGIPISQIQTAKQLDSGKGYLNSLTQGLTDAFTASGFTNNYYKKHSINCAGSNLHLTYSWGGSDYFEANGKFKPNAKVGDYGVLFIDTSYTYTTSEPKRNEYGELIYTNWSENSQGELVYETVSHTTKFTLILFCKQESVSRWRFTLFADLGLQNLIYAGKSIFTRAYDALMDSASTAVINHNFSSDGVGQYTNLNLRYIVAANDSTSAFIVPLEDGTFRELGQTTQMEIAYGSQYLIFNCWIAKKKKWYQRGFFSLVVSFVGIVVSSMIPIIGIVGVIFFSTVFVMVASGLILQLTQKLFTALFGESLGNRLYAFLRGVLLNIVVAIIGKIPVFGWAIAAAIMFSVVAGEALNNGESLKDAFTKGLAAGAVAGLASYAGTQVGQWATAANYGKTAASMMGAATTGLISGTGQGIIQGKSFGSSLKAGLISGVLSGAVAGIGELGKEFFSASQVTSNWDIESILDTRILEASKESLSFLDQVKNGMLGMIKNPGTYVELIGMTQDEIQFHKLANLENDYKEFSNKAQAAMDTLNTLQEMQASIVTAGFVNSLSLNASRLLNQMPDLALTMAPETFIQMATISATDIIKQVMVAPSSYSENKLTMDGYEPYSLHYTKTDYSLTWDYL